MHVYTGCSRPSLIIPPCAAHATCAPVARPGRIVQPLPPSRAPPHRPAFDGAKASSKRLIPHYPSLEPLRQFLGSDHPTSSQDSNPDKNLERVYAALICDVANTHRLQFVVPSVRNHFVRERIRHLLSMRPAPLSSPCVVRPVRPQRKAEHVRVIGHKSLTRIGPATRLR